MTTFRTGYGASWLDFLATLTNRYKAEPVEHLPDPAAARHWLAQHGLEPAFPVGEIDLAHLRELREALHRAAVATTRGEVPGAEDMRVINKQLARDEPVRLRRGTDSFVATRPQTPAQAIARLARQAAEDLTGPQRALLRPCGDLECSGIFLDPTGRRRWCSDELCGVRARVRAHRARARVTPG